MKYVVRGGLNLLAKGYRFDDLMRWAAADLIKRPMLGAKMKQFADIKDQFKPVLDPSAIPVNDAGYIAPHWIVRQRMAGSLRKGKIGLNRYLQMIRF